MRVSERSLITREIFPLPKWKCKDFFFARGRLRESFQLFRWIQGSWPGLEKETEKKRRTGPSLHCQGWVWPVWRAGSRGCCRCVLLSAHARQSSFGSLSFSWGFCPERKEMRQWSNFQLFHCIHDPFGNTETSTKSRQRMWNGPRPPIQVRLKISVLHVQVQFLSILWLLGMVGRLGRWGPLWMKWWPLGPFPKKTRKTAKRSSWIEALSWPRLLCFVYFLTHFILTEFFAWNVTRWNFTAAGTLWHLPDRCGQRSFNSIARLETKKEVNFLLGIFLFSQVELVLP